MPVSNLFDGYNAGYAQELYEQFARNPDSVPPQWHAIFSQNLESLIAEGLIVPDAIASQGRELRHVAVGRVEQLYPFPERELATLVDRYPELQEVVWAQEEPRKMVALGYIGPPLRTVVSREISLRHVARPEWASPAEGRHKRHRETQLNIIREALVAT